MSVVGQSKKKDFVYVLEVSKNEARTGLQLVSSFAWRLLSD